MNQINGFAKLKLGGKNRPIKFGTNATGLFCQMRGIKLAEANKMLQPEMFTSAQIDGTEVRDLVYCGLRAAALEMGEDVDFNIYQVGSWLDVLFANDREELEKLLAVLYNSAPQPQEKKAGKTATAKPRPVKKR